MKRERLNEAQRDEILSTLAGSTTAYKAPLVAYLVQTWAAADARALGAAKARQIRSNDVRAGIRLAIASKPLVWKSASAVRGKIFRLGPLAFGLEKVPDIETVEAELAAAQAEAHADAASISNPRAQTAEGPETALTPSTGQ
jgi:hypothetical protein